MEGEGKKSGFKKRSKLIQTGFDSHDDEPIGNLFKLKNKKNPKKVKAELDGSEKVKELDAPTEKFVAVEKDFGGFDDTLASFRKKLKGPKKESGSGIKLGDSLGLEESNLLCSVLNGSANDGGLGIGTKSLEKVTDKDELNANINDKVENKEKAKRSKSVKKVKETEDNLDGRGPGVRLMQNEKVRALGLDEVSEPGLDDNLEDSLSVFLRKAQSGSIRKSRINSRSRLRSSPQTFKDEERSNNSRRDLQPVDVERSLSSSLVYQKLAEPDDCLCIPSDRISIDSTFSHEKMGLPQSTCEHVRETPLLSRTILDNISSTPVIMDVKIGSSDNRDGRHPHVVQKDIDPISSEERSQSHFSLYPHKISESDKAVFSKGTGVNLRRFLSDYDCTDHLHKGNSEEFLSVKSKNDCSLQNLDIASGKRESYNAPDGFDQFPRTCSNESQLASFSTKGEDALVFNCGLNGKKSCGVPESEFKIQKQQLDEFNGINSNSNDFSQDLYLNDSVTPVIHRGQPFQDKQQKFCIQNDDYPVTTTEANGVSSASVSPDRNCNGEVGNLECKDKKRKPKKRRHDDMAYEGDVDWDVLVHGQDFSQYHMVVEDDQFFKGNVAAAAVSAGLKARAAGPMEKIKFKDILKRKGGLHEYLTCRNQILALWNKDVTRVLPLTECGVTASSSADEPPRDSLVREIYTFLNQSGYINVGIASEKDLIEPVAGHNLRLVEEKTFGTNASGTDADAVDGVSFILGQVQSSVMDPMSGNILDDQNHVGGATREEQRATPETVGVSTVLEFDQCQTEELHKSSLSDSMSTKGIDELDDMGSNTLKAQDNGVPVMVTGPATPFGGRCPSCYSSEGYNGMQCESDGTKRIIVIGAGPAGLTAARHLQRQGFSVTVLEARSRVGGRVYTDRSSLSVPVDLGASIITGVEADVATERRADPSSLVCAQLGLELTVLNSDCPLYDVVTGQKVPAELDESLEAEYNSLLDDMLLLVAQKGEKAMKMSLEDGLEYALKGRRMAHLGKHDMENELGNIADALDGSTKNSIDKDSCKNDHVKDDILSPLERRVMDWHFAHLEYGCAALLKDVSLPYWNQDDVYGGFGGAHCMIKGGYGAVVESLGQGLHIHLNHVVTNISYCTKEFTGNDGQGDIVKVCTSSGREFSGDAVLITVPLGCLKAEAIKFFPPLPDWKDLAIKRLGFGVLNKVVLEFSEVFWDDSVDYFGATAEQTDQRGKCFMFWNVKKTVGAPVLIALVVGKAAIGAQKINSFDLVNHALRVLRKLFGKDVVPEPVASVVTDWGNDPFSYGAYSYVAVGASGEDYDILGRPVENCLFFAGEATCKEYPDTVGGAMLSGLREAVRIINLMVTGDDYTVEVETSGAAQRHSDSERNEVRDLAKRLEAIELSNALYKNSLEGARIFTRKSLLKDIFSNAKTTAGRLFLAKEMLKLPVEVLKSFAGTKNGLSILNTWILDSMGKDGTQLLRHCVRLLVLVSTDLLAVRLSGVGKTIKEKVCVHTSRDIRAIASQLVNVWIEVFRKEKASNGGLKSLRQSIPGDSLKNKSISSGKLQPRAHSPPGNRRSLQISASSKGHIPPGADSKRVVKPVTLDLKADSKMEVKSSRSQGSVGGEDPNDKEEHNCIMSEEEKAAFAAAEAARAAAIAAAEAYASSEAKCNTSLPLPKIPSFHKFARRKQYTQMDEYDIRKKWSGGTLGRHDCISEIDSRNCRVRDWSVAFPAACASLENLNRSTDNLSQRSHSNEVAGKLSLREHSAESAAVDSSIFTKAWVDGSCSIGIKDYSAIDRWQSQAAAAESDYYRQNIVIRDEEDSNMRLNPPMDRHERTVNESVLSQVTVNKDLVGNQPRGAERIKQAVVDFVASLLMPLYKAKKIDKEGYKSIMKKTATKVMEQTTDAEKAMAVYEFLDFKRKTKIRAFVDKLIEKQLEMKPIVKPGSS